MCLLWDCVLTLAARATIQQVFFSYQVENLIIGWTLIWYFTNTTMLLCSFTTVCWARRFCEKFACGPLPLARFSHHSRPDPQPPLPTSNLSPPSLCGGPVFTRDKVWKKSLKTCNFSEKVRLTGQTYPTNGAGWETVCNFDGHSWCIQQLMIFHQNTTSDCTISWLSNVF